MVMLGGNTLQCVGNTLHCGGDGGDTLQLSFASLSGTCGSVACHAKPVSTERLQYQALGLCKVKKGEVEPNSGVRRYLQM